MPLIVSNVEIAATELHALGISLTIHPGTYGVNFRGANAATMYFSDELEDALAHGKWPPAENRTAPHRW